jgi:glucokinase
MTRVLGIDIGATKTRLARFEGGKLVKSEKIRTRSDSSHFLLDLKALIDGFIGNNRGSITGIGVGAPGPLDLDRGVFRKLPNLPSWDGFDIRGELESHYGRGSGSRRRQRIRHRVLHHHQHGHWRRPHHG